jgi:hypothetical protein
MKNVWTLVVCLALTCCDKPAPVPKITSGTPTPPPVSAKPDIDGVPGPILPLPAEQLLGAGSVQERNDLAEAVVRHAANKPPTASLFVGFHYQRVWEGHGYFANCDFPPDLLKRLSDLKPWVNPVSRAEGGGPTCIIQSISLISTNEAEVRVRSRLSINTGTLISSYHLFRREGKWAMSDVRMEAVTD